MNRRFLLIAAATAVALVVLLVSLLAGPERSQPEPPAPAAGPPDVAPGFDPDRALGEGMPREQVFQDVHRGYSVVEGDRYTVMTWEKLTPKPQGVSEVTDPVARVYFAPSRVLEIRADQGTLIAPENQPREGDLHGNVVLTLFETDDDRAVDFDTPRDIRLRAYLDRASFDLELGHIESESPVHLTGPRVDFRGRGLSLTYNELRRRIERLEIFHGHSLRFSPEPAQAEAATTQPTTQPATRRADGPPRRRAAATRPATQPAPAPDSDEAPESHQLYQARFLDDVRVRAADGSVSMDAAVLEAIFSLAGGITPDGEPSLGTAPPFSGRSQIAASKVAASSVPAPLPAQLAALMLAQVDTDPADARSLAPRTEDDITITWTGRLVVLPIADAPEGFAGPEDILLALEGPPEGPAVARTDRGETITGARIDYLASTARLRAEASDAVPMVLRSPELGELRGQKLSITQATGEGVVLGPGSIEASTSPTDTDAPTTQPAGPLLRDLHIAWEDRLDLAFYLKDDEADAGERDRHSLGRADRIAALRTADFHGHVVANHPDFNLVGERLSVALTPPGEASGTLRTIDAAGDVSVAARGERPDDQLDVDCQALTITLDPDGEGSPQPSRLLATGDVHAVQPGLVLDAQSLDVALGPPPAPSAATQPAATQPATQTDDATDLTVAVAATTQPAATQPTTQPAAQPPDDVRLAIRRMHAERDVRVVTSDPEVTLAGDRLTVDVDADQLELFGSEEAPARVVRPDATLSGRHIVMHQARQAVHVIGPGWFDVDMDPADPTAKLQVTWRDALHYDDAANMAHFVGNVRTHTNSATSRTRLTCEDLRLDLAKVAADSAAATEDSADAAAAQRNIRFATARQDVLFTAERLDPEQPNRPMTRVRLEGPVMTFDGESEQVQVVGAGRMLLQDHRADEDDAAEDADAAALPGVNFAGRGDALFLWREQLTLDARRNDMLMEDTVQMIHRPADGGGVVQMDCQVLLADLEDAGGLNVWTREDAPDPQVQLIRADGAVRIVQAVRTIVADHLRYTADDRTVLLTADGGDLVRVTREDQPVAFTAEAVKWNLATDRMEATQLGPGVVPIPRR